jgi:hypothetical protein
MTELEVFEPTTQFGKDYSHGLQFTLHKQYYDNLKSAQLWKMPAYKESSQVVQEVRKNLKMQPTSKEEPQEYMKWLAQDGSGFTSPFEYKQIPLFTPTRELSLS